MSSPVLGTDMMVYWYDEVNNLDVPVACSKSCTLNVTPTFKNVTDYQSAFFVKQKPDVTSWAISAEGLIILQNFSYLYFLNYIKDRTNFLIKFVVDNGVDGLVIFSGRCYVGPLNLQGTYNDAGSYNVQFIGTGEYSLTGTSITPGGVTIVGGTPQRYEYTVPTDGTSIVIPDLVGSTVVLSVERGTQNTPTIIYAGTPAAGEIRVTLSSGTLTAPTDEPFVAGEIINGIYS